MSPGRLGVVERALFLMEIHILRSVGSAELARVAGRMTEENWEANRPVRIDRQMLYVIVAGRAELRINGLPLMPLKRADAIGLLALIGEETDDELVCMPFEDTHVLCISRDGFFEVMYEYPDLAVALVQALSGDMLNLIRRVEKLERKVTELRALLPGGSEEARAADEGSPGEAR